MMDGIFKDFLLNVPQHNDMVSGKSGLCYTCQAKISQGVGRRIDNTDTISKRLIRVDSHIYPFHLKETAVLSFKTSLVC
jgi:hypothetical protein